MNSKQKKVLLLSLIHILTAICAVSLNDADAKVIQELFSNDYLRVYTGNDEIGSETGVALKNAIAVASGVLKMCIRDRDNIPYPGLMDIGSSSLPTLLNWCTAICRQMDRSQLHSYFSMCR